MPTEILKRASGFSKDYKIISEDQKYPMLKIVIPPDKSRDIFFKKLKDKEIWKENLQKAMGFTNVFDFYKLEKVLGKG